MEALVSVIMPAYNSASFIGEAIGSVLNQDYQNVELLIINDGSIDQTEEIVNSFSDQRIRYFYKENGGVSSARNVGLRFMRGAYFCFLDADDVFTQSSILSRIEIFDKNPRLDFVDGAIEFVDVSLNPLQIKTTPGYTGQPFPELLKLNEKCFIGNTWMIKRNQVAQYEFPEDMTHGEELFFYLTISRNGYYTFTHHTILLYRQSPVSAMRNLSGLQNGYRKLLIKVKNDFPEESTKYMRKRIIRIMFLSWLIDGRNPWKAISSIFEFLK